MNSSDVESFSDVVDLLNNSNSADAEAILAFFGFFVILFLIICLLAVAFKIISRWVFFKKCGEEGWKALIPIYTDLTLLKVSGLNWWWILIIYAGTILSTMQSSLNIMNEIDTTSSVTAMVAVLSVLSMFASFAALFAKINQSFNISKKFNKNGGYTVLLVLFEPIMLLILGASKNEKYDETVEVSPNGLFGANTTKTTIYCPDCGSSVQEDFCPKCGKKVR